MSDIHVRYCHFNFLGCTRQEDPPVRVTVAGEVLCGHCQDPVEGEGIHATPYGLIVIEHLTFTCVGDAVEWAHYDEVLHICGLREVLAATEDVLDLGLLLHYQTTGAGS